MSQIMSCKTNVNSGIDDKYLSTVNFASLCAARKEDVNRKARNDTGPDADRDTSPIKTSN